MEKAATQPKKASKRKLTKQERKFVKIKAKTGNGTRAVQEAFDIKDPDYASVKAVRLLGNDRIVKAIADELPDELLLEVHLEGLAAGKHIYKNNNESGEIEDMGIEPDYATRHKYLDSAYKLKGTYAPEKSVSVNIEVKQNREKLAKVATEVMEKLSHEELNG